jgi:hypothetical protein
MAAMEPYTVCGINRLDEPGKREIYTRLIPDRLYTRFRLTPDLHDEHGQDLLTLQCSQGSSTAEMALYHRAGFCDPLLYGHITDTANGHLYVLLYILNDPESPRFDIDRLPDGSSTQFGTKDRNLAAEMAALNAGLAPGQVRRGLRMLGQGIAAFDRFVRSLGNDLYFIEPLFYHSAVTFEKYGFAYERGRQRMEAINAGFAPGGECTSLLDSSTPFRKPAAARSIRLRSWAIHDGLLGEPFDQVTMYRRVGKPAGISTARGCPW